MTTRVLLFVDDVKQQQVLFKDAVRDWNENNPERQFETQVLDNHEEAVEALRKIRFDGALFDLRLRESGKGSPERPLGNDLAERGLNENGIPVAIISGKPDEVDSELADSPTVKVLNKGDGNAFAEAVEWFGEMWPMLEALSSARSRIRKVSARLFVERIWPSWGDYLAIGHDENLTPVLARQFIWHLSEVMGTGGETADLWHPLEAWICPPLQADRASTGDVLEHEGDLWIVMTPPCDLANAGKVENVLLAKCRRDDPPEWGDLVNQCINNQDPKHEKAKKQLTKLFNQSAPSQHYLPPLPGDPRPVVVQFGSLRTIPVGDFQTLLPQRIGSVTAPFVNNLIQRFGANLSRVGQPNLNVTFLPTPTGDPSLAN
jgi:hypothetical protein